MEPGRARSLSRDARATRILVVFEEPATKRMWPAAGRATIVSTRGRSKRVIITTAWMSLVAQRDDRVEARGAPRRIKAEQHADGARGHERDQHRRRRERDRPRQDALEQRRAEKADEHAGEAAAQAEDDRLAEK